MIIAGVFAYNAMAERKVRKAAEKAFGGADGDALLDPAVRREPTMGGMPPVAAGDVVATASGEPLPGRSAPAESGESEISNRIDTIALVLADDPVTVEQVAPFLRAWRPWASRCSPRAWSANCGPRWT